MKHIKTWNERCEEHPDHNGIVTHEMIQARMQEEIDELRSERDWYKAKIQTYKNFATTSEKKRREWVGLTEEEITACKRTEKRYLSSQEFARAIEAKLRGKNT